MHQFMAATLILLLGMTTVEQQSVATENAPLKKDEINKVWKARRQRLQAIRVKLSYQCTSSTLPYMSFTEDDEDIMLSEELRIRFLKEKVKFQKKYELVIDSPRIHCSYSSHKPGALLEFYDHEMTEVYDGKIVSTFHRMNPSFLGKEVPYGLIQNRSKSNILSLSDLNPLRWSLLAGDSTFGYTLDDFQPLAKTELVNGVICTVLEKITVDKDMLNDLKERLWVAPKSLDCVVMKNRVVNSPASESEILFRYNQSASEGPLPVSWKVSSMNTIHNTLIYGCDIKVDSLKVNSKVSPADFEINFPVGTRVTDLRKRDPRGGEFSYIVKANEE